MTLDELRVGRRHLAAGLSVQAAVEDGENRNQLFAALISQVNHRKHAVAPGADGRAVTSRKQPMPRDQGSDQGAHWLDEGA